MGKPFKLPELGENVESGEVVNVLVQKGDVVSAEQPVIELETDKATVEVPVSFGGKVQEVEAKKGDTLKVGDVVLVIEDEGAKNSGHPQEAREAEEEEPAEEPEEKKTGAEETKEAEAKQKEKRAQAKKKKEKAEARTKEAEEKEEEEREPSAEPATEKPEKPEKPEKEEEIPSQGREVAPASPTIRRLARELGVDIDRVEGRGPGGRISEEDVKRHVRSMLSARRTEAGPAAGARAALPDLEKWGPVERRPLDGVRRKTSEHVSRSWTTVAHVTHHDQADVTELEALRKRYAPRAEAAGGKLTVTAIALKVAASALSVFPKFAAALDVDNDEIVYRNYRNLGVAVDTDRGLLVPVIRDVGQKNIVELARELTQIAERAREGKLTVEDMRGGVFTITNLGGIGGTSFSPIVNWPEVAILGLSRSRWIPVARNGSIEPRLHLPLSLSYDHRVIDGAEAARFVRWIAEALESPFVLALEG